MVLTLQKNIATPLACGALLVLAYLSPRNDTHMIHTNEKSNMPFLFACVSYLKRVGSPRQ